MRTYLTLTAGLVAGYASVAVAIHVGRLLLTSSSTRRVIPVPGPSDGFGNPAPWSTGGGGR